MHSVVIIGATGTLGKTLGKRLAAAEIKVIAAVRDKDKAQATPELKDTRIEEVDAESWESVESLFKKIASDNIQIDGVVVCVGSILLKPAHLTKPEEFEAVIRKNLIPCCATLRSCVRPMMKHGGSIVFVSSAAAKHGFPNHEAIAAAKSGIIGLTLSGAASYANYGIRVNCVAPGLFQSEMSHAITSNEQSLKASKAMHALGRIGDAGDVARAIQWLLDPDQTWVTGQTIGVDGGLASLHSKKS